MKKLSLLLICFGFLFLSCEKQNANRVSNEKINYSGKWAGSFLFNPSSYTFADTFVIVFDSVANNYRVSDLLIKTSYYTLPVPNESNKFTIAPEGFVYKVILPNVNRDTISATTVAGDLSFADSTNLTIHYRLNGKFGSEVPGKSKTMVNEVTIVNLHKIY